MKKCWIWPVARKMQIKIITKLNFCLTARQREKIDNFQAGESMNNQTLPYFWVWDSVWNYVQIQNTLTFLPKSPVFEKFIMQKKKTAFKIIHINKAPEFQYRKDMDTHF